jgi:hypothetical protein
MTVDRQLDSAIAARVLQLPDTSLTRCFHAAVLANAALTAQSLGWPAVLHAATSCYSICSQTQHSQVSA